MEKLTGLAIFPSLRRDLCPGFQFGFRARDLREITWVSFDCFVLIWFEYITSCRYHFDVVLTGLEGSFQDTRMHSTQCAQSYFFQGICRQLFRLC